MATQVFRYSLSMAAAAYSLCFFWMIWQNYDLPGLRVSWNYYLAEYNVETRGNEDWPIEYVDLEGQRVKRTAGQIYTDPELRDIYLHYAATARRIAWVSALPGLIVFAIVFLIFTFVGRHLKDEEHIRGARLVSAKDLKAWSLAKWKAYEKTEFGRNAKKGPRYTLAGIEFPPNAIEAQTGFTGTVGVGKTNAFHELLNTVRADNGRGIIYDRMGGLLRDHYDPENDIILNPFDARSVSWSPFNEATDRSGFAQIAEVMVPDHPGSNDPFWTKAARLVFLYAARELAKAKGDRVTNADLRHAIMNIPSDELAKIIESTPGSHFFGEHVAKTSGGIRANLITELAFLEYLRDDAPAFSIRDWVVNDRPGFVWLTGNAEQAAATRNIISTVLEVAANALMTTEESRDPKIWFFLDEVPTLNKMPFLPKSLAEIRQFGGAFVLGYQVFSQLEDIYGDKAAQTISGVLNNRVVFNTPDPDTAERSSKSLGEEDVVEMNENLTLGAHETRDGVGLVGRRTQRRIVTPAEIQSLPQFAAYFRPAYDAPAAKVRFNPVPTEARTEKFVPYTGNGFDEGGMQVAAVNSEIDEGKAPERGFAAQPQQDQRTEFLRWLLRARPEGAAGIDDPTHRDERDWYWQHFATERIRGVPPSGIAPPDPTAWFVVKEPSQSVETSQLPYPEDKKEAAEPGRSTAQVGALKDKGTDVADTSLQGSLATASVSAVGSDSEHRPEPTGGNSSEQHQHNSAPLSMRAHPAFRPEHVRVVSDEEAAESGTAASGPRTDGNNPVSFAPDRLSSLGRSDPDRGEAWSGQLSQQGDPRDPPPSDTAVNIPGGANTDSDRKNQGGRSGGKTDTKLHQRSFTFRHPKPSEDTDPGEDPLVNSTTYPTSSSPEPNSDGSQPGQNRGSSENRVPKSTLSPLSAARLLRDINKPVGRT